MLDNQRVYGVDGSWIGARRDLLTADAFDLEAMVVVVSSVEFDDPEVHRASLEKIRRGISELVDDGTR